MRTILHGELRTNCARVLRETEDGETFTITVEGSPVATLGPYRRRQWVAAAVIEEILATPTDETLLDELRTFGSGELPPNPEPS
jgi:antitoxin (DNA-binding transcriptional repressor) of toxin-antitoxin stability system